MYAMAYIIFSQKRLVMIDIIFYNTNINKEIDKDVKLLDKSC